MVNKNFACKHFGPKRVRQLETGDSGQVLHGYPFVYPCFCRKKLLGIYDGFTYYFKLKPKGKIMDLSSWKSNVESSVIKLVQSGNVILIMHLFLKSHSPNIVGPLPPPPFLYTGGWEGLSFHKSPKRGDSSFSNKTRGIGKIRWYHLFSSLLTLDVNVSVFVLCVSFAYLHYFYLLSLCFPEMN